MIEKLVTAAIFLGLGYYLGHEFNPKTITKTEQIETVKKDILTVVKEVTKKDGTKKTIITTTDHSTEVKDTESSIVAIIPKDKMNRISLLPQTQNFREIDSYTLSYERRLAGPLWIGINYNTKQIYGIGLGLEF